MTSENTQQHNKTPWLDPYKFKPGESGNPGGRPAGSLERTGSVSLTGAIRAKFREEGIQSVLVAIDQLIKDGNVAMLTEIWNRLDGKVSDRVELHGTMLVATPDQLDFAINALLEDKAKLSIKLLEQGNATE